MFLVSVIVGVGWWIELFKVYNYGYNFYRYFANSYELGRIRAGYNFCVYS